MARPHTTYKKRQKELARMEKQRQKAAKRMERKTGPKPAECRVRRCSAGWCCSPRGDNSRRASK